MGKVEAPFGGHRRRLASFRRAARALLNRYGRSRAGAERFNARLASLVKSSQDAILAIGLDGTVLAWNAGAEHLYGYAASEILGKQHGMLLPPTEREQWQATMSRIASGDASARFETRRLRRDGSLVEVSITASPILSPTGEVTSISTIAHDISSRVAAKAALCKSEADFRALVELAPDGIFIADLDGRYTDVNENGARLLRSSRERIVGRTIVDLIPAKDIPRLEDSKASMLRGAVHMGEWTLRRDDGSHVPVEVSANILPDGRWLGFVRDISRRKEAERELRSAQAEERRLREQLAAVTDASQAVAEAVAALPRTDIAAVLQTLLLQAQTVTGAEYAAVGVGEDPEKPFDLWVHGGIFAQRAKRIGAHPHPVGTLGLVAREGVALRERDIRHHPCFRGFPAHHPEMTSFLGVPIAYRGRAVGNLYLANKRDAEEFTVDDQRAVEMLAARVGAALETAHAYQSEAIAKTWLQSVIDQMPDGVVLADPDGRIVSLNRAALGLTRTGTGCEDGSGGPLPLDARHPNGEPARWEELPLGQALFEGRTVTDVELVLHTSDGRRVPVRASGAPVPEGGAVMVLQDITLLKEVERLREEWTSVIAHDLRQPLSVIALSAQMLSSNALPSMASKLAERIRASAARLTKMIEDLLDRSTIEAHRLRLTREVLDPVALVRDILDRASMVVPTHTLELRVRGEVHDVSVDAGRIEQVLLNLLSNAAKYGHARSEIAIEVRGRPDELELSVTNYGDTLAPEELSLLFERFYRTARAEAGPAAGSGLGLYVSRGLVEAHGGRIWAESSDGRTSFRFVLPFAEPDRDTEAKPRDEAMHP